MALREDGLRSFCGNLRGKSYGIQPNTSFLRGKVMDKHCNPTKKPFRIGQLVRFIEPVSDPVDYGLDIVLDLRWRDNIQEWQVYSLCQRTGVAEWQWSEDFVPIEENDGNL